MNEFIALTTLVYFLCFMIILYIMSRMNKTQETQIDLVQKMLWEMEDLRVQADWSREKTLELEKENAAQSEQIVRMSNLTFKNNMQLEHTSLVENFLPTLESSLQDLAQKIEQVDAKVTQS